jgi:rSAM/selenodomain-associated transferase 2
MPTRLSISVVIPVLGDPGPLAELLSAIRSAESVPDELIVIDGGTDGSAGAVAMQHGCIYRLARPGRGHQLNAGAACATGDVIWFLHADARPPETALAAIREVMADGAVGGYFRFGFSGELTWYKRLLAGLINIRTRFGVPYGDQGLFIDRSVYAAAGGFTDSPLFEEVSLIKAVRRRGPFVEIAAPIGVSPRRWEQDGWFRRTLENRLLALGYILGVSPHTLARRYRSKC